MRQYDTQELKTPKIYLKIKISKITITRRNHEYFQENHKTKIVHSLDGYNKSIKQKQNFQKTDQLNKIDKGTFITLIK